MTKTPWTIKEIDFIEKNHQFMTHLQMSKILGRTKISVRDKCLSLNLNNKSIPGNASWRILFKNYKNGATNRNLSFSLTFNEFVNLISASCYYCGNVPRAYNLYLLKNSSTRNAMGYAKSDKAIENSWVKVNGIDRVDNGLGYESNNCVPCCTHCNFAKGALTQKEFLEWVNQLIIFQKSKSCP